MPGPKVAEDLAGDRVEPQQPLPQLGEVDLLDLLPGPGGAAEELQRRLDAGVHLEAADADLLGLPLVPPGPRQRRPAQPGHRHHRGGHRHPPAVPAQQRLATPINAL